jgi:hypothetical protein
MSDNDSEFDDFEVEASPPDGDPAQMEDEDDDLVAASSPAHAAGDEDDEDEYDAPDDDAEEEEAAPAVKQPTVAKEAGKKKAAVTVPAAAPAAKEPKKAEEADDKDLDESYLMRNNVAYMVPLCPNHDGPGRVRDFGDVVTVEDDNVLGSMHLPKNWPSAPNFPPTAIVVLKAKHTPEDVLRPVEDEGPFGWYARVVTKQDVGKTPRKNKNKKILRLIPKKVVQLLIKYLSEHSVYNRSSLIQRYQPAFENSKVFRVDINGWTKCPGIKSTGIAPKKESKEAASPAKAEEAAPVSDDEDLDNDFEPAETRDKGSPSAASKQVAKAKAPTPSPAAEKKKSVAPAPAPEAAKKAPSVVKKGGMLNFAKPTKTVTETAPAAAPEAAPPVEKAAPAPAPPKGSTSQDKAAKGASSKAGNEGTSGSSSSSGQKRALAPDTTAPAADEVSFKRVRTLVVNDAEKSVTFWKGNTLYIAEL